MESTNAFIDHVEIDVYADGSFNPELRVGAWAFKVPKLNLEGVGSSEGKTTARFEFLAVMNGLEAVLGAEGSDAPIHIFTDCESTVSAIERLSAGLELRKPEKYADRTDLMPRMKAALARRRVHVTRLGVGPVAHQDCHRNALRELRQVLANDTTLQRQVALERQRARLAQLLGERGSLVERLEKVEQEIMFLGVAVEALEASLSQLEIARTIPVAGGPALPSTGKGGATVHE